MKRIFEVPYENKNQKESLNRFVFYINSYTTNKNDIVLKGQYKRGIGYDDKLTGSHYLLVGMMAISILCKNAKVNEVNSQNTSSKYLEIFKKGIFSTSFLLCFEFENCKHYEVECIDFYISDTIGYCLYNDKYIQYSKFIEIKEKEFQLKKGNK